MADWILLAGFAAYYLMRGVGFAAAGFLDREPNAPWDKGDTAVMVAFVIAWPFFSGLFAAVNYPADDLERLQKRMDDSGRD